ncbi:hypothetical protein EMCRGX_G016275 [Ephydatia muelleri]
MSDSNWCFSPVAIALLDMFISRYVGLEQELCVAHGYMLLLPPRMFEYLNSNPKDDMYYEADLFPEPDGPESWSSVQEFLKQLPTYGLEPVDCLSDSHN